MCVEVGLNMFCHLRQSLDQFAPDMDEHYDLEPGVARPVLPAFHRLALSFTMPLPPLAGAGVIVFFLSSVCAVSMHLSVHLCCCFRDISGVC